MGEIIFVIVAVPYVQVDCVHLEITSDAVRFDSNVHFNSVGSHWTIRSDQFWIMKVRLQWFLEKWEPLTFLKELNFLPFKFYVYHKQSKQRQIGKMR